MPAQNQDLCSYEDYTVPFSNVKSKDIKVRMVMGMWLIHL